MAEVSRLDRAGVVMSAHVALSDITAFVHRRFGATVGSVWVMAHKSDPDEDSRTGKAVDLFVVKFSLSGRDISVTVSVDELSKEGSAAVGSSYDRLMGKRS